MRVIETGLKGALILEPRVHRDDRGFFLEAWNERIFREAAGTDAIFVQDNHSRSTLNVVRGIHYQVVRPQGKLVRVTRGSVLDVLVDLRRSSCTFGQWVAVELSEDNHRQVWAPPGFGHGFRVLSGIADFLYKTTDYWYAQHDRVIAWNDPQIGIDWCLTGSQPLLSAKDSTAPMLAAAEVYP